jgi:hypothetical protein
VHHDEAAPHCHILLLPLVGRRMIGSDLMGGPATLEARQADFHAKVGKRYGLALPVPRKRYSAWVLNKAMEMLVASFMANSGLQAHIVRTMLAKHAKDPEPLIKAMEMEMPREPSGETFVGIMTKPVKPDRPKWAPAARRFGGETTPGFAHRPSEEENADNDRENIPANEARKTPEKAAAHDSEKTQTLSCVGFRISGQVVSPTASQQSDDCMQRERVGDIGLDADVIDHRSFTGSDIGALRPRIGKRHHDRTARDRARATRRTASNPDHGAGIAGGGHGGQERRPMQRTATHRNATHCNDRNATARIAQPKTIRRHPARYERLGQAHWPGVSMRRGKSAYR